MEMDVMMVHALGSWLVWAWKTTFCICLETTWDDCQNNI